MPAPVNQRVQKRRDSLRAAGLGPIQIWVPATRRPASRKNAGDSPGWSQWPTQLITISTLSWMLP